MDTDITYLSLDQILVIHYDQIERYGGSHGIHDITLLESALFRPQSIFSGEDLYASIFEKAAAQLHSLVLNNPFRDGNKRTAITAAIVFLQLNRQKIKVDQKELVAFVIDISMKMYSIEQIGKWIHNKALR